MHIPAVFKNIPINFCEINYIHLIDHALVYHGCIRVNARFITVGTTSLLT